MMDKKCIVITGPSTVGKSTVAKKLDENIPSSRVIPLSTCRSGRRDDDSNYIRVFSSSEFNQQKFFVRNGNYGLLLSDISKFEASTCSYGICILGAREIIQIQGVISSKAHIVLLRFSSSLKEEIEKIRNRIPKFFKNEDIATERIKINTELAQKYFHNSQFTEPLVSSIHLFDKGADKIAKDILQEVS